MSFLYCRLPKADEVDFTPSRKSLTVNRSDYGGSRTSLVSQADYHVVKTRAFGRINFEKDAKNAYEPPVSAMLS